MPHTSVAGGEHEIGQMRRGEEYARQSYGGGFTRDERSRRP